MNPKTFRQRLKRSFPAMLIAALLISQLFPTLKALSSPSQAQKPRRLQKLHHNAASAPVNVLPQEPMINSFEPTDGDCFAPDPRRGILSYRVSNVSRVRIEAIHRDGRVRTFYSQGGRAVVPGMGATGVADPGAAADIEAYELVATGAGGSEVRRRRAFRYRVVEFNLLSAARHIRDTTGKNHLARYEADARLGDFDSLSCSFRFSSPIAGEMGRVGIARLTRPARWPNPVVTCEIEWRDVRKARAGGTVTWIAVDSCGPVSRRGFVGTIR